MDQSSSKQFSDVAHVADTLRGLGVRTVLKRIQHDLQLVVKGMLIAVEVAIQSRADLNPDRVSVFYGLQEPQDSPITMGYNVTAQVKDNAMYIAEVDIELNTPIGLITFTGTYYSPPAKLAGGDALKQNQPKSEFALRAGTQTRGTVSTQLHEFISAYLVDFPETGLGGLPTRSYVIHDASAAQPAVAMP